MQRLNFHEILRAYCTTLKLCTFKGTRVFFLWWHIIPLTYLFQIIFLVFFNNDDQIVSFFLVKKKNLPLIIFTKSPVEISHFFLHLIFQKSVAGQGYATYLSVLFIPLFILKKILAHLLLCLIRGSQLCLLQGSLVGWLDGWIVILLVVWLAG